MDEGRQHTVGRWMLSCADSFRQCKSDLSTFPATQGKCCMTCSPCMRIGPNQCFRHCCPGPQSELVAALVRPACARLASLAPELPGRYQDSANAAQRHGRLGAPGLRLLHALAAAGTAEASGPGPQPPVGDVRASARVRASVSVPIHSLPDPSRDVRTASRSTEPGALASPWGNRLRRLQPPEKRSWIRAAAMSGSGEDGNWQSRVGDGDDDGHGTLCAAPEARRAGPHQPSVGFRQAGGSGTHQLTAWR